ncbi:hypothetical protein [Mediterraneibacter gnavus]|uniref:Uncharacterized protein n=1 Tax=Mediterraneibacter gnavus TaxID=33038 RepID=A0A8B3BTK4_MEDGN|nr:hypothetical protein [Mediterraneibacter gnavus]RHJ12616.1 hypothetical protein DW142_07715 [Mediterraneibacter gnavus]
MLKMVDGTGIIGVDMICPLGVSTPQPPNYDRVELEGAGMLVLPNSLDAPLERLELGGKTEQFSTKGLNLFNYKDFVDISTYADEGAGYRRKYLQLKPNTSYRMTIFKNRMSPSMDATVMFIGNKEKYDNTAANGKIVLFTSTDKKSATIVTGESGQIVFKLNENSTPELQEEYLSKADIILSEGSTEIPYEPYTGGKPSPSPEYQQEIKSVGKWNEEKQKYEVSVKVTGKNLLNLQKESDVNGLYRGWKCGDGEKITLSIKDKNNNADISGCFLGLSKNGDSASGGVLWLVDSGIIKVKEATSTHPYVTIYSTTETTIKKLTERFEIQCERGTVATDYAPYAEQTLTLTSDRPITKWDRLVEQGGEIGWLYNSVNETIDGKTGKWSIQPASKIFYRTDITFPIAVPFCSELLGYDYSSVGYKKDTGITINNLGILCITLPEEVELTPDAYKQYLADNPLHVLYKGDSEEFVPLPEEEQNAIRALKTYYPTTVITVDGGELDPDIKVTYRKEK